MQKVPVSSEIIERLENAKIPYNIFDVEIYISYLKGIFKKIDDEKKRKNDKVANLFFYFIEKDQFIDFFIKAYKNSIVIDGELAIITINGLIYTAKGYKHKLLRVMPESKFDLGFIYDGDIFTCQNISGKYEYKHVRNNIFCDDTKKIIGLFFFIKNRRGEFFTTLSKSEVEKRRETAKTDVIWKAWEKEMYEKTIVAKACKQHFNDVVNELYKEDIIENSDVEKVNIQYAKEIIDGIQSEEELVEFYRKNKELFTGDKEAEFLTLLKEKKESMKK